MRIAAIDLGTNSIHMVVAEAQDARGFEVIDREREVVQIGRGSFDTHRLRADAVRRTLQALQRFVELARRLEVDHVVCTATAAVREAENGGEFLIEAQRASGVLPRVIPAAEEARLIYLAVDAALPLDDQPALIVDIGGGSMQLVVGDRSRLIDTRSVPLGALRLTERIDPHDPPTRADLQRFERVIRKGAREALDELAAHAPRRAFGSSGSIHALAEIAHYDEHGAFIEHINGHVLSVDSLRRITRKLQAMRLAERETLPGIDAKRAEIIIPGAMVLLHVLRELGLEGITISDFGVREGLVTDYIRRHAEAISATGHVSDLRLRSVLQIASKFEDTATHSEQVARLALSLFDRLTRDHGLGAHARELLHFAALLHDVGAVIGYDGHGEHSYYIIKNSNLRGMTAEELERIAIIARYHGKARPKKGDAAYAALPKEDRRMVRWLAALLAIAESLDRSRYQLVRSIRVVRRGDAVVLKVQAPPEARLELWAARRRAYRLERELGQRVGIVLDAASLPAAERRRLVALSRARRPRARAAPSANGRARRAAERPAGGRLSRGSTARRSARPRAAPRPSR